MLKLQTLLSIPGLCITVFQAEFVYFCFVFDLFLCFLINWLFSLFVCMFVFGVFFSKHDSLRTGTLFQCIQSKILVWAGTKTKLTLLPITNSARIVFMSQPPPIRNEIWFPVMVKYGDVRVPWCPSPWYFPAGADLEGRSSYPPIQKSPCWLAGCPKFLAVGLSP